MNNGVREQQSLEFTPDDRRPKTMVVQRVVNPEHRFLAYRVTSIFQDGRIIESPPRYTLADRAIVQPDLQGHQVVSVSPSPALFEDDKVTEAEVILQYADEQAGLDFMDTFVFRSADDRLRFFEFDFAEAGKTTFQYQLLLTHSNGLQRTLPWRQSQERKLILSQ